ncbi:MAG: aminoacyl-tRNA hydrolase [Verrucomicrobiales bacterium]|nr:aminoacyl-tRNA hydrolase [Verrucomicrobiales bacterium]MCP5560051.1 aminoacyl-tRNA hydrolase [Verrucomicrobiaceae bacterium]
MENTRPRLIVGLGNPGIDYRDTRHNIGFMVMDALADRLGISFTLEKRWNCLLAKFSDGWLVKPQTYMNASGRAAANVGRFFKITPAETLAVFDDVDLQLGRLRIRPGGSAAGHNGIRSMIQELGTQDFPRLKVGIAATSGRPAGDRMVGHVLGRFAESEKETVLLTVGRATDAVLESIRSGLGAAMNLFNRKEDA